jgi:hypothetical protein
MNYILGETKEEIGIENVDESRDMIENLVKQATHSIKIFSQDLDDNLYDNLPLKEHMTAFASNAGNPEVHILVQDLSHAIRNSHRIVRLSQTLSSFIFIREPCDVFRSEKIEFVIVDDVGVYYRVNGEHGNYHAEVNFNSAGRAKELNHFFTQVWEQSEADPDTRELMI